MTATEGIFGISVRCVEEALHVDSGLDLDTPYLKEVSTIDVFELYVKL